MTNGGGRKRLKTVLGVGAGGVAPLATEVRGITLANFSLAILCTKWGILKQSCTLFWFQTKCKFDRNFWSLTSGSLKLSNGKPAAAAVCALRWPNSSLMCAQGTQWMDVLMAYESDPNAAKHALYTLKYDQTVFFDPTPKSGGQITLLWLRA